MGYRPQRQTGGGSSYPGNIFNVKAAVYGAKGDARSVSDAGITNSSTVVTSATAVFTTADVGKVIFGIQSGTGLSRLPVGIISSINSATSVNVTVAATGTVSNIILYLGTDDSDAILAAAAAAKLVGGNIYIPSGKYLYRKLLFDLTYSGTTNAFSVTGDGSGSTIMWPIPDYDIATTSAFNSLVIKQANSIYMRMYGIQFDFVNFAFAYGLTIYALSLGSAYGMYTDIHVTNVVGALAAISVTGGETTIIKGKSENSDGYAYYINGPGATCIECYGGNSGSALFINAVHGSSNNGAYFRWIGGVLDENTNDSVYIQDSTDISFIGARLFGPSNKFALVVDGTSNVKLTNCEVTPFGAAQNRSGMKILSGGVAYVSQTRFAKTGTGITVNNAGTIYDNGGNSFGTITGTAPITLLSNVPTADPHMVGQVWANSGVLTLSAG